MGGGGGRVIRSRMRFLHLIIMIAVTILILQAVVASEIGEDKDHHHQISKTPQLPLQPWMKNWNNIKQTISTNLFRSFLFPPIGRPLASKAAEGTGGKDGVETTGEKMKDAMGKSVDKPQLPVQPWMKNWNDIKQTISTNLFRSFLFPPIGRPLASKAAEGTGGKEGVETTGEKMKDAMGKSVDKAKQTIEDSAKSAADKLKKTLYSSGNHPHEL